MAREAGKDILRKEHQDDFFLADREACRMFAIASSRVACKTNFSEERRRLDDIFYG